MSNKNRSKDNIIDDGWNIDIQDDSQEEEESELSDGCVQKPRIKKKLFLFPQEEVQPIVEEEPQESKTTFDLGKETWRISFYKRAFPVKKYEADFPDAARKVYMDKRRPLWLPQQAEDEDYLKQASYFSEVLAKDQAKRQAVLEKIYKPNFGEYAYCRSDVVGKTYISKYMKGVHCCKFSPSGEYLLIGTGNGTIQAH